MYNDKSTVSLTLAASRKKKEKAYWLNQLSGHPVKGSFPFDYDGDGPVPYRLETIDFSIPQEIAQRLLDLSKGSNQRLFIVLMTGIFILLRKYSGNKDILLGIPVSRSAGEVDLLNSALAIRCSLEDTVSFRQLLSKIRQTVIEGVNHQNFPIKVLTDLLGLTWSSRDGFPLFDVVASLKNIHYDSLNELFPNIIISFERSDREIKGRFSYNTGRCSPGTTARLVTHFRKLLEEALADPDKEIAAIELLSEEEKREILVSFNDTAADFPEAITVHQLVDRRAGLSPRLDAVVYKDQRLSYAQLKKKTLHAAAALRQKGVGPNSIVAVLFDHSPAMVVTLMGILKTGAAYLPIAPDFPPGRIEYITRDSHAKYIVAAGKYLAKIQHYRDGVLSYSQLENHSPPLDPPPEEKRACQPHDPAYIIYTSGSTGKPKGVVIRHRSFIDFTTWAVDAFEHRTGYQVLLSNSYASDGAVQQIYPPLVSGGTLHLIDKELRLDVARYLDYLKKNRINNIDEVPVLMNELLEQIDPNDREEKLPDLTCLCLGSEYVPMELVRKCRKHLNRSGRIINAYGPAEASVETTAYHFDGSSDSEVSLIGKPRRNTRVYILDQASNCCPIGVRGEICISGVGLASGYINKPELTAQKFVLNRHSGIPGDILYKTGDQGCWLEDGNIRFFGRIDDQTQVRGFRVELSEIQRALKSHEKINDSVVMTRENKQGESEICAYYLVDNRERGDVDLDPGQLRQYLETHLPSYMIPAHLMELGKIPLTPNGKIDKKALPDPGPASIEDYIPPRDDLEKKLAAIWAEVLGRDPGSIGVYSDFFQLGGHSLKAVILISRIQKQLEVDIGLVRLFETPTIAGLSQYIASAEKNKFYSIKPVEKKEYYPLSWAQRRMYIEQQVRLESKSYNVSTVVVLEGEVKIERLNHTFQQLIKRHENLRTSFGVVGEEMVQRVHDHVEFQVRYDDTAPVNENQSLDPVIRAFIRPFDFSGIPLLRAGLKKIDEQKHLLIVDMHHIISDGMTHEIMVKEFFAIYNGENLPPLKVQYRDFAGWQNRLFEAGMMEKQEKYWLNQYKDKVPILNLPTDHPRTPGISDEGDSITFHLEEKLTPSLYQMLENTGTTLFMFLLAAYNILLSKFTGQTDIIVVSAITGRRHTDLENVVGMFVNMLAMRNRPRGEKTFSEFLHQVKINALDAYENQDYPFIELVKKLNVPGKSNRSPLLNAVFTIQNFNLETQETDKPGPVHNLKITPYGYNRKVSLFDLNLVVLEARGGIRMILEYSTQLFEKSTIREIAKHYLEILNQVIQDPGIKIKEVKVTSQLVTLKPKQIIDDSDFGF